MMSPLALLRSLARGRLAAWLGAGLLVLAGSAAVDVSGAVASSARTATPSGNGVVAGRVLRGSSPVAGSSVTLVGVPTSGTNVTETAVSDSSGSYSFGNLPTGASWSYSISARYQGALFSTDQVTLASGAATKLDALVFGTTTSPAKVHLDAYAIWVDYSNGKMAIQQDLQFTNSGKTAYVGTHNVTISGQATPTAVALPLVPGAATLQYLGRFGTCCSVYNGDTWWHTRPITPGSSRGTMRYEAPVTHTLAFPMPFETGTVALLVPKGVSVSVPGLKYVGTKSDTGTTYSVYQGGPFATDAVLTVNLGSPPRSWATFGWIGGAVALLLLALIAFVVWRRRSRSLPQQPRAAKSTAASKAAAKQPATTQKQPKPTRPDPNATRPEPRANRPASAAAPKASAPPTTATTTVDRWNDLADQLARLDLAYESGGITDEATYRTLREALVAKLVAAVPPVE